MGWYTSLPTLRISDTDALSGPGLSYFADVYGSSIGATYTPPGDGLFGSLRYYDVDLAGNGSWAATLPIKVDTTRPTLSVLPAPDGTNGWYRSSPVTFSLSGSDATSGFRYAVFSTSFAQATVSANGYTTLRATGYDWATNSTNLTYVVKMDNVAPSLAMGVTLLHATAIVVPVAAGMILNYVGYQVPFFIGCGFALAAALVTLRLDPAKQRSAARVARKPLSEMGSPNEM